MNFQVRFKLGMRRNLKISMHPMKRRQQENETQSCLWEKWMNGESRLIKIMRQNQMSKQRRVLLAYLKDAVSKNKYHSSDCCPPTETRQLLAQIIPKGSENNIVLSCTTHFISSQTSKSTPPAICKAKIFRNKNTDAKLKASYQF